MLSLESPKAPTCAPPAVCSALVAKIYKLEPPSPKNLRLSGNSLTPPPPPKSLYETHNYSGILSPAAPALTKYLRQPERTFRLSKCDLGLKSVTAGIISQALTPRSLGFTSCEATKRASTLFSDHRPGLSHTPRGLLGG